MVVVFCGDIVALVTYSYAGKLVFHYTIVLRIAHDYVKIKNFQKE